MMISSDGITREISAEDAVPWQPRPLAELNGGAPPTLEERLEAARKEGYQQGYREAVAESEKIQSAQNARINELLRYLGQPLASVDETLKQSLLSLAAEMASRIVAREIGNDLDYYRTQLDQLSDTLPAQVKVTSLRLRPEKARELRLIRNAATDAASDAVRETQVSLPEVVDDAELAGDVCLACWQDSAVDISLRGRLAAIVQSYCGDNTTEALAIPVSPIETDSVAANGHASPVAEESALPKSGLTEPGLSEPGLSQRESPDQQSADGEQMTQSPEDTSADNVNDGADLSAITDSSTDAAAAEVEKPELNETDTVSTNQP